MKPRDRDAPSLAENRLHVCDLGLIPFLQAVNIQKKAVEKVAAGGKERIFFAEHPRVITLGRHSGREHLHVHPEYLSGQGIALVQTSRGGSVTCHYPGQLVAYFIMKMARRPGGLRGLVHDLEQAVILALARFDVHGRREPGRPGVWVGERKIASIGLGLRKWVSWHGLALNVGRDTSLFDLITLCGLHGVRPTSVHRELGQERPGMQEMKNVLDETAREVLCGDATRKTIHPLATKLSGFHPETALFPLGCVSLRNCSSTY